MKDLSGPRRAAARLAVDGVDVNELEKILDYYRRRRDDDKFRSLVKRLSEQDIFIWSRQTKPHRRRIREVVLRELSQASVEPLWFMGWTARFMRYYDRRRDEARALLGLPRERPAPPAKRRKRKGGRR